MPSVANGMQVFPFLDTSEGAEIMYQCKSGFQPQETITAVCESNAQWSPDPALHNCTGQAYIETIRAYTIIPVCLFSVVVDCGIPEFVSSSSNTPVTSTIEGATISFQCEEGLLSSGSNSTTIQCTNSGNMGQWRPDPATLCSVGKYMIAFRVLNKVYSAF